jgi:hypothetical protein
VLSSGLSQNRAAPGMDVGAEQGGGVVWIASGLAILAMGFV